MISRGIVSTCIFLTSSVAFAEVQTVTSAPSSFNVSVGDSVEFTVKYPSTNPANATGLGLKIFYNSSKLGSATVSNILQDNLVNQSAADDVSDLDGDNATDKFVNIAWASFSGAWLALDKDIVTVSFITSAGFTSDTVINFTGRAATGHTFAANSIPVNLVVPDITEPVVTAPADLTKEATDPITAVSLGVASATDNIDTVTPIADNTGPFTVGTHTVTWSATDNSNNTGTDTQTVTITDTTPPVISTSDITIEPTATNTPYTVTATVSDLVDGATVTLTSDSSGSFPIGTTDITWTATDSAGNSSTKEQKITVSQDTSPPVITVRPPESLSVVATGELTDVNLGNGEAVDNVDGTVPFTPDNTGPFAVGTHTITWAAVDSSGNRSTATTTLIVSAVPVVNNTNTKPIPTLSEWGIIFLSFTLFLASWIGRRKTTKI